VRKEEGGKENVDGNVIMIGAVADKKKGGKMTRLGGSGNFLQYRRL